MKTYIITERAGDYLAGRRVASIAPSDDGQRRIELSDEQALYELDLGTIELSPVEPSAAPTRRKGAEA